MYRSRLSNIYLLAAAFTKDIVKFGIDKVLEPFFKDIDKLSRDGIIVRLFNGQQTTIKGDLVAVVADTLGCHQMLGFKEGVGFAKYKCRHCMANENNIQEYFYEDNFTLRNVDIHLKEHCKNLKLGDVCDKKISVETGVNRLSTFFGVRNFNVFACSPQDIMHIILEGTLPHCIKQLLNYYINEGKFNASELSERIANFPYSYIDQANKPSKIDSNQLTKKGKLRQSSSQMWLLARILPLLLSDLVDFESQHWKCFSTLLYIVMISVSPIVNLDELPNLDRVIAEHLNLFKNLFPDVNIIPKQHYMLHISRDMRNLGPVVRMWCMRFEAKHSSFKKLAASASFKNVLHSLTVRHQKIQCQIYLENDPLSDQFHHGPLSRVSLHITHNTGIYDVKKTTWIRYNGSLYKTGCLLFHDKSNDLPQFGKVMEIYVTQNSTDGKSLLPKHCFFELNTMNNMGLCENINAYILHPLNMIKIINMADLVLFEPLPAYSWHSNQCTPLKSDLSVHV